jgi:hypothetical protein
MKIYKTQEEIEKDIKNGELFVDEDVTFECSFVIRANIRVSGNINARGINARDINAGGINAHDINAVDINAGDINAGNINAWDINAHDIDANDISYYAVCFAYSSFKCHSVEGSRENCRAFCLDGEIEYKDEEKDDKTEEAIALLKEKGYRIVKD